MENAPDPQTGHAIAVFVCFHPPQRGMGAQQAIDGIAQMRKIFLGIEFAVRAAGEVDQQGAIARRPRLPSITREIQRRHDRYSPWTIDDSVTGAGALRPSGKNRRALVATRATRKTMTMRETRIDWRTKDMRFQRTTNNEQRTTNNEEYLWLKQGACIRALSGWGNWAGSILATLGCGPSVNLDTVISNVTEMRLPAFASFDGEANRDCIFKPHSREGNFRY